MHENGHLDCCVFFLFCYNYIFLTTWVRINYSLTVATGLKKKEEISAYIMAKDLGGTVRLSLNRQIQPNSLFNVILECIIMRWLRKNKEILQLLFNKGKKEVQFYSKGGFLSSSDSRWGKQHIREDFEKSMSSDIGNPDIKVGLYTLYIGQK